MLFSSFKESKTSLTDQWQSATAMPFSSSSTVGHRVHRLPLTPDQIHFLVKRGLCGWRCLPFPPRLESQAGCFSASWGDFQVDPIHVWKLHEDPWMQGMVALRTGQCKIGIFQLASSTPQMGQGTRCWLYFLICNSSAIVLQGALLSRPVP